MKTAVSWLGVRLAYAALLCLLLAPPGGCAANASKTMHNAISHRRPFAVAALYERRSPVVAARRYSFERHQLMSLCIKAAGLETNLVLM